MSNREMTRPEDMAYSLMGMLDVNMPIFYGEGSEKAFIRLQLELTKISQDHSLFLWCGQKSQLSSALAAHPRYFDTGVTPYAAYP